MITLNSGPITVTIHPQHGGRIGSVTVDGYELLIATDDEALRWGSYPMIPFVGRTRHGRFTFDGHDYQLPLNMGPHAIHGMAWDRPWTVVAARDRFVELAIELDDRWPFGGRALQRFIVSDIELRCEIEVQADQPMPVTVGWHPWFRRPCAYSLSANGFYPRALDHVVSGEVVAPPTDVSFDDCFCHLNEPPKVWWPNGPTITITSSCDHLVVFDEPTNAVCIEPQSGPPDALNLGAVVVKPGSPMVHWMVWALGS
jgi:aldose 1-epimerase